jgi:hypothetical protein
MARMRPTVLLTALAVALVVALPSSAAAAPGDVTTVAGNGTLGAVGDGGPATAAEIDSPRDVSALPAGGFLIADTDNNEIRMVSPSGVINTVAGTGVAGYDSDGILATNAQLNGPRGVEALPGGGFLIADFFNHRVRMVDAAGIIHTVAGDGTGTSGGDGGPATSAGVEYPRDISLTPDGGFLIGEHLADCVRKVNAAGVISTVAGICGMFGNTGNGGPATAATFNTVNGVSSFPNGSFIVTDGPSDAVRIVGTDGIIRQAAGNGTSGFSGDGGPALSAALDGPRQAAALPDGSFFFADHNNNRVRLVDSAGVISTAAGDGTAGFSGDGGCARSAAFNGPESVAALPGASSAITGVLIPDADNERIRSVQGTDFSVDEIKRKPKKGIAVVKVTFPGPGTYSVSGPGVKSLAGSASSRAITSADKVKLRIRASGKKGKKLKRKGKVNVAPVVSYTPTCWGATSKNLTVKLVKRAKRAKHKKHR